VYWYIGSENRLYRSVGYFRSDYQALAVNSGVLEAVFVHEGDKVRANEPIARWVMKL